MTSPRPKAPAVVVSAVRPRDGSLVPSERDVVTGRLTDLDRDDKNRRPDDHDVEHGVEPAPATGPAPVPRPRFPRWAVVAAGAAVVVVVACGVAVASGALGGGDAPAAVDAAGADDAGSGDGGTGEGSGGDLPPEVDPAQVVGYTMTSTRTTVEAGPDVELRPEDQLGSTSEITVSCTDGMCTGGGFTFQVGQDAVSFEFQEGVLTEADGPCFPVTMRSELTLGDDGSYTGTRAREPMQVFAQWSDGDGSGRCSSVRWVDEVVLVPVLAD